MSAAAQTVQFTPQAESLPAPRWAPLLAGLPHLSMGIILSIDLFIRSVSPEHKSLPLFRSGFMLLFPFLAASLVIAFYARRHSQPMWTASWDGYAILLASTMSAALLGTLNEDTYAYQAGFVILGLLAILIGYFLRFRSAPRHAMLMGLLLLPSGALVFLDTLPLFQQAVFVLGLYLLYGLLSAWVVISPGWAAAISVAFLASLLAAGIQAVVFVTYSTAPATHLSLQAGAQSAFWIQSALISAFFFAPWLLWKVRDFFMRGTP